MQVQSRENTRQLSPRARSLWAKTGAEEMRHRFSPLYVHMSDSGQTMRHLWREWLPVSIKQLVTRNLELDEVSAENTLAWLAAVHDIGKATPGFQCKNSDLAERVEEQGLPIPADMNAGHVKHAVMGQIILERWIARRGWAQVYKGDTRPAERTYAVVIGGHHGAPPSASEYNDYKKPLKQKYFGEEEWQAVQLELLEWAWNTTGASAAEKRLQVSSLSPQTQMIVTGLVIMTDWIASNTDYYPLINSLNSEEEAERRGADAWRRLSLPASWKAIPPQRDSETLFHCRFPKLPDEARLRPVQEMALKVSSQAEKPCMIIIEAPMGNGKTEASLLCAEMLASKFGEGGLAYLLPTMATSNAMFNRVEDWLECLVEQQGNVGKQSIRLVHGKAALNKEYARLSKWESSSMGDTGNSLSLESRDESVIAHQWFSGRKTSLLASFVVGTVDQLLMAALRTKHIQLRHLGLAGKVVVIDEVHAYDVYMNRYLDQMLWWLGSYSVPVVLLSATLPPARREELVRAYKQCRFLKDMRKKSCAECGKKCAMPMNLRTPSDTPAYPMITYTDNNRLSTPELVACPAGQDEVDIRVERFPDDDASLVNLLVEKLEGGGCACVLRDTVQRAQHTYEMLTQALDIDVMLVHSRFIGVDRLKNDEKLLKMLGPNSEERPSALVVVGTQVIEQSLDIDFDLMVTDIAPVDLLLQRMGRLHRHPRGNGQCERPFKLRRAHCYITGVEDWDTQPPKIISSIPRIYKCSMLWRTIAALDGIVDFGAVELQLPRDIAGLVETVYGNHLECVPASWQEICNQAVSVERKEEEGRKNRAGQYLLSRPPSQVGKDIGELWNNSVPFDEQEARAAVRDGEDSLEVVVVQRIGDDFRLLPWVGTDGAPEEAWSGYLGSGDEAPDDGPARLAAQCSVSLPAWFSSRSVADALNKAFPVPGWDSSRWLKGCIPLALDRNLSATIETGKGVIDFKYSREEGLQAQPSRVEGVQYGA